MPTQPHPITIALCLPRELEKKIRRLPQKLIACCLTPCMMQAVPDSPDPDKTILGIRIERTLKRRVARAADAAGLTMSDWVRLILIEKTSAVTLSSADYEQIAREVRAAEEKLPKPNHSS